MHDQFDPQRMNEDAALTAALHALPTAEPPRDGWQRLSARIAHGKRKRILLRIALPAAALAAGIAVAMFLPHARPARQPMQPLVHQQTVPASTDANLIALRAHSQRLQAWVRTLDRGGAPLDGDALANAVALQDRIGLVDLQLTAARDSRTCAALWQQRVTLLQQLGLLHLQPYTVAEHTRATPNETTIL